MKTLLQNIQSALAGSSVQALALAAIIGNRLFYDFAPMGTLAPYCVIIPVARVAEDTFTGQIDRVRIQVACVSAQSSSGQCWDMVTAVEAFFTTTAFDGVRFARVGGRVPFRGGEQFWRADPEFRAWLGNS